MGIWQDIRYGTRSLAKQRGITAISVMVLAIGIGANTALFAVANAVLLRPVPGVRNPAELTRLVRIQPRGEFSNSSYPDYADYRDQSRSFAGLVAERAVPISFAQGSTERISGAVVTGNYFAVLGIDAAIGRLLTPDDDRTPGAHPVATISYRFWRRVFGGDPSIIGRQVTLNGYAFSIVGVAAREFSGMTIGEQTDLWVPMMLQREAMPRNAGSNFLAARSAGWLTIYGRLRPGVSLEHARAEIRSIAGNLERAHPETNLGRSAMITRDVGLYPEQRRDLRNLLGLLLGSVALLLVIACQNVANLFLTRAASRRREIAVRLAIGAGRWRLVRQWMTESFLLCLLAAALGLLIAPLTIQLALKLLGPADAALSAPATVDGSVLLFTFALTLATGLLFGLAPALQASKTDVLSSLKATMPASECRPGRAPRLATLLLIGQITICAVLLVGAGLVVKTMTRILSIQPGFQTQHVLLAAVDLAIQRYSEPQGKLFCEQLVYRLMETPGVESASLSKSEPARDWSDRRAVFHPDQEPAPEEFRQHPEQGLLVDANRISPGYFRTLGIPLVAGRDFAWSDREGTPPVAIVSQQLAARLWPGESAIGKPIAAPNAAGPHRPPLQVIGVAGDAKYRSMLTNPPLLLYESASQNYDSFVTIEVLTKGDPAAFAPVLRRQIAALDSNLPVYGVRTFSDQVNRSLWQQRSAAVLIGAISLISVALASIGLYSQLAHSVATRTREIGIRMALGADSSAVRGNILRQGLMLASIGASAGLVVAASLASLVKGFLYGVTPLDPSAYALTAAFLILVTMLASYFPSRTATRVDPMTALRSE